MFIIYKKPVLNGTGFLKINEQKELT